METYLHWLDNASESGRIFALAHQFFVFFVLHEMRGSR
jgi:hypothetical protein